MAIIKAQSRIQNIRRYFIMARRSVSIDEKIARAEERVKRTKASYDKAVKSLKELQAKRDDDKIKDVLAAAIKSGLSPEEIKARLENNQE